MFKNTPEKGLYAPQYYTAFCCIADRCRHSCCIDWEICIDEETYEKYKQIGHILDSVEVCEDGPCFALGADGRCPHLNDAGLCEIILSHGEDHLSEICRNHPRFFNYIKNGYAEAGLGIVCEEACRLILTDDSPFALSKTEALEEEPCDDVRDFDPLPQRARMIAIIEGEGSFDGKLAALKNEFAIPTLYSPDEWIDRFLALEILDADWAEDLRRMKGALLFGNEYAEQYGKYYARLLIYFIYRHVAMSESEEELRARLAFSILSTDMIRALFEADLRQHTSPDGAQALECLINWSRRYSGEIEYSEDNTDELIFAVTPFGTDALW